MGSHSTPTPSRPSRAAAIVAMEKNKKISLALNKSSASSSGQFLTVKEIFRILQLEFPDLSKPSQTRTEQELIKKAQWYEQYLNFIQSKKILKSFTSLPILGHKPLDLHLLYTEVEKRGGLENVIHAFLTF